jgi:O-antigen/teichoic acid export membrane protein
MVANFAAFRKLVQTRGLGQNALLSFVQGLAGTVVFFVAIRLLIRHSGTEMAGLWSLTVGVVAFSRIPDISGGAGLARLVAMCADDPGRKRAFIDTVTLVLLGYYGLVVSLGLLVFPPLVARMVEPEFQATAQALVPWVLASLVLTVLMTAQTTALDGLMRADLRAKVMLMGAAVFGLGTLALIPRYGVFGFAAAQLAQQAAVLVVARWLLVRELAGLRPWPAVFSRAEMRDAMGFGLQIQANSVPQIIYEPVARIMINSFAGLHVLAVYDLAYKLCSYTRLMIQSAATPLIPAFAQLQHADRTRLAGLYRRTTLLTGRLTGYVFVAVCLAAPLVSWFLFGAVLGEFLVAVGLLSLAWSLAGIGLVPRLLAQAMGRMHWNIIGEWSIAALTLGLGFAFATLFGNGWIVAGVAAAVAVGQTIQIFGNQSVYRRVEPGVGGLSVDGVAMVLLAGSAAVVITTGVYLQ